MPTMLEGRDLDRGTLVRLRQRAHGNFVRVISYTVTAAITIAYSLIVSILLVPPAMTLWGAYQNMRLRSMTQRWAAELDEMIDAIHCRHEAAEEPS